MNKRISRFRTTLAGNLVIPQESMGVLSLAAPNTYSLRRANQSAVAMKNRASSAVAIS